MSHERRTRFPLQLTISALFISLSISLGALLSIQNYSETSDILLSSARQVYDGLGEELKLDMKATYRPLAGVLEMLAISSLTSANTLEQRLNHLQTMRIALDYYPAAANLQIAYGNGDYFILRQLTIKDIKSQFRAPLDAAYMIDNIETTEAGKRILNRRFFNQELDEIASEPAAETDYDPRLRDWYTEATPKPSATEPYLFYFSRKVGITAKMKTRQPGVVIAADITLGRFGDTIKKYDITPSTEAVLVNSKGQTLAYKDPEKVILSSDDKEIRLANLDQLGSHVLSHLGRNLKAIEEDLNFSFDNQQWVGGAQVVASPGGVDLYLNLRCDLDSWQARHLGGWLWIQNILGAAGRRFVLAIGDLFQGLFGRLLCRFVAFFELFAQDVDGPQGHLATFTKRRFS